MFKRHYDNKQISFYELKEYVDVLKRFFRINVIKNKVYLLVENDLYSIIKILPKGRIFFVFSFKI